MERVFNYLMKGTFNAMKGPILSILMLSIVVSIARHLPSRPNEVSDHRETKEAAN